MAVPIGTGEYVIMIITFSLLWIGLVLYYTRKWIKEQCVFTVFEFFAILTQKFCITRIITLAFLLYLRYGFAPMIDNSGNGSNNERLVTIGNYLAVTWEFLYLFGFAILFTLSSIFFYKSRVIAIGSAGYKEPLGWAIVSNIVVYAVTLALVIVQYVYAYEKESLWVHLAYIWIALLLTIMAFLAFFSTMGITTAIERREAKSENSYALHGVNMTLRVTNFVALVSLLTRSVALAVDAYSFKWIKAGTNIQVMWNVFFKYVLWIVPELLGLLAMCVAMQKLEQVIYVIAHISTGKTIDLTDVQMEETPKDNASEYSKLQVDEEEPAVPGTNVTATTATVETETPQSGFVAM